MKSSSVETLHAEYAVALDDLGAVPAATPQYAARL